MKIDGLIFIQEPTPTKFKLIVNVTDNKENSISNAIVYTNQEGRSTEGGSVEFMLDKGYYTVKAYKAGHENAST